ncbi:hypothetical protein BACI71_40359 [Bacillus mycoides]|uniref:Uncharacterized protein n=1 Tax=Bacillus mycoides TaxID=1405 RepID=A0A653ZX61_BACMY|nr:hypothetical protein BACI71_40359 [Bacillus mycoides]
MVFNILLQYLHGRDPIKFNKYRQKAYPLALNDKLFYYFLFLWYLLLLG